MNRIHNRLASAADTLRLRAWLPLFASALTLFLPAQAIAQATGTGTVSGRVLNIATGNYLENAQVRVVGTDRATNTVSGGRFVITGVPAGDVRITASYSGLDTLEQMVTVPARGSATVDFNLTSALYSDQTIKLDEFIIAGVREGNARAIVDQREAANVKTVIASDAFGSVSEDNVGEFLKFMSGLSIDYVENDARQVRVRGMSAKYASVTVDGNPIASADFGIATGRSFQFEQVSLSTADVIEVNKSPLADQPASSLAGTINVKSKSALNQKGRRIEYNANLTLNEYAMTLGKTIGWDDKERYKALPGGSLEFSDTFLDGRLGLVASANHTGTYVEQKIIANIARTFDNNPDNNATEVPRVTQVNWQDGLKPTFRDSMLINLDYQVSPDMIVSLRTSYNAYNAPFHNRNWTINASTATQTPTDPSSMSTTATSATDTGNTAVIAGTNFRKYGATFNINPAINWKIRENITFDGSLSYSRSYQWYDSDAEGFFNIVSARMRGVSWGYTSTAGEPDLQFSQGAGAFGDTRSFFDLANYNDSNTAQTADRNAKDQFWTGRGDITIEFPNLNMPTVLKFGVDSRLLVKDIENWTRVWSMNVNSARPGYVNLNAYPDPYTPDPHKGQTFTDVTGRVGDMPSLNKWSLYDLFTQGNTDPLHGPVATSATATTPYFLTTAQAAGNLRNRLQNMWDFKEKISSAYVRGDVKLTPNLLLVGGLRFESTDSQGKAFDNLGHRGTLIALGLPTTIATNAATTNQFDYIQKRFGSRTTKTQSYDDVFPSMQIRYTPRENLVLRGAYYRSILRPDVDNLATGLVVNDDQTVFTTANPDLQPEYADNFEVRAEYYFEPVGVFSAGVFYKKIEDIQVTTSVDFTVDNVPQDIIDLGYDPASLVSNSARLTTETNGPATSVRGFELDYTQHLSFLPGAWSGLSVFANYTYTKLDEPRFFTGGSGVPTRSANLGVNYKTRRFTGQVKFNWVNDRLLGFPGYSLNTATGQYQLTTGNNSGVLQFEDSRLQIDVNLDYQISHRTTIYLNIANLTAEPSSRYAVREANLIRHGAFGAKYTIGIKGSF